MKIRKTCSIILLFFVYIFINACNPVIVPLKGQYATSTKETFSSLSNDSIWSNIEHLFITHGLPVTKVDKTNEIITTRKTAFIPIYTFENENGQLQEPDAWVVLPKTSVKEKQWKPKSIYSQWHIQLTDLGSGTTSIKVDPVIVCTYYPNSFGRVETSGQSTGKLEELLRSSLAANP
jgi:hypothetical protein